MKFPGYNFPTVSIALLLILFYAKQRLLSIFFEKNNKKKSVDNMSKLKNSARENIKAVPICKKRQNSVDKFGIKYIIKVYR